MQLSSFFRIMHLRDSFVNAILSQILGNESRHSTTCIYTSGPEYLPQVVERDRLIQCRENHVRIVIISDTHDRHDKIGNLPLSDVFIHCGDIFMTSRLFTKKEKLRKLRKFNEWLATVPSTTKIIIAGNHDSTIEELGKSVAKELLCNAHYLENESFHVDRLHLFCSPLSQPSGSSNRAFQ